MNTRIQVGNYYKCNTSNTALKVIAKGVDCYAIEHCTDPDFRSVLISVIEGAYGVGRVVDCTEDEFLLRRIK